MYFAGRAVHNGRKGILSTCPFHKTAWLSSDCNHYLRKFAFA
ncbi:hypothetical protein J3R75_001160 [Oligosphaera ethanolica]|uniref:Uncharacterized protein n=1 Tax=Oligosphaera ethanolica TaxID=760260 RepID=A0AAE3VEJ9_9BACT|nr:hypothetical protein [Oligosphaera ethanolica]